MQVASQIGPGDVIIVPAIWPVPRMLVTGLRHQGDEVGLRVVDEALASRVLRLKRGTYVQIVSRYEDAPKEPGR